MAKSFLLYSTILLLFVGFTKSECIDHQGNDCAKNAANGLCTEKYPDMLKYCQLSCNTCPTTAPVTSENQTTITPTTLMITTNNTYGRTTQQERATTGKTYYSTTPTNSAVPNHYRIDCIVVVWLFWKIINQ